MYQEKREIVQENYLDEAIKSLELYQRYWNGSISRTLVSTLREMLQEKFECEVHCRGLEPE